MSLYTDSDRAEKVSMMSSEEKSRVDVFIAFSVKYVFEFIFVCFPKVENCKLMINVREHII